MKNRFRRPPGPWITLGVVALVGVVCAVFALGLQPSTGLDTLVSSGSADYQATQADAQQFGASAVVVLVHDPLSDLIKAKALTTVSELEACLGGQQLQLVSDLGSLEPVSAKSARPYGGAASPCGALMRQHPAKVIYGPGTFLNHAVAAVNQQILTLTSGAAKIVKRAEQAAIQIAQAQGLDSSAQQKAAKAAGELALQQQLGSLGSIADEAAVKGSPSISDPTFLGQIVFADDGDSTQPSSKFSYLFPSADASLIQVRLRAGLSDLQQSQAIKLIRAAVAMPRFHIKGASYTVTGEPVLLADVASGISGQLLLLLVGVVVVMGAVLLAIFRRRLPLLPLAIALCAAAVTFGLAAIVGAQLTIASIAVLPVLVGLAVDYAVQYQSGTARASVAAAGVATAAGFLALLLSPVPMVRGFGLLLVLGVLVALALTRIVVPAVSVVLRRADRAGPSLPAVPAVAHVLADAWWGAVASVAQAGARAAARFERRPDVASALAMLTRRPAAILAVGVILAAGGWVLEAHTAVQSDITKLVPSGTPALRNLEALERTTGVSGEIDVLVNAGDVATPRVVRWMVSYEDAMTRHFGYTAADGCGTATLCPALSLPDLLSTGSSGGALTQTSINALLKTVPAYFKEAVLTANRRYATLAFGIRLMPLTQQRALIAYMRSHLHPPGGVGARLAGLPVLAADADASLSSSGRRLLSVLLGLVLVALVLLGVFRAPRRALIPLVPIVLATGWSALILYLLGIALNPLSATLGALVIAISTEFSVLLAERVRSLQQPPRPRGAARREGGARPRAALPLARALEGAYRSTGVAVLTSGVTVIIGFGVLILSNITMLRNFGLVTLIDLTVSLVGVLAILPAVLAVAERGYPAPHLPRLRSPSRPRLRRRPRAAAGPGQTPAVP